MLSETVKQPEKQSESVAGVEMMHYAPQFKARFLVYFICSKHCCSSLRVGRSLQGDKWWRFAMPRTEPGRYTERSYKNIEVRHGPRKGPRVQITCRTRNWFNRITITFAVDQTTMGTQEQPEGRSGVPGGGQDRSGVPAGGQESCPWGRTGQECFPWGRTGQECCPWGGLCVRGEQCSEFRIVTAKAFYMLPPPPSTGEDGEGRSRSLLSVATVMI